MWLHREQRTFTPLAGIRESSKLNLVKQEAQVTNIKIPFLMIFDHYDEWNRKNQEENNRN
jgi:hypothetical protein